MELDPEQLKQPEDPTTVVEWIALELASEEKAVEQMTPDERMLIVQSDLLSRIVSFYRATEEIYAYYEHKAIKDIRKQLKKEDGLGGLYKVELEFGERSQTFNLFAFMQEWKKKGATEWTWRKELRSDEQKTLDAFFKERKGMKEASSFSKVILKIWEIDTDLLDSLFPAMQELSMTFKWEKMKAEYKEILAKEYPKLVQSVKDLEQKVKAKREAEQAERNLKRARSVPSDEEDVAAAADRKKPKHEHTAA